MPRESLDATYNLPKEGPCQVAFGELRGEGPDVGPITRAFSTRKDGVFNDPHRLTLLGELVRRQVAQRAVWPALIVIDSPRLDLRLRVGHRRELILRTRSNAAPTVRPDMLEATSSPELWRLH